MSDQEGPSKKQRISRACDRCRRRKSKCDGRQPICTICESTNSQCLYSKATRKRGLPTGYVRSLEIALGLVLDGCSEAESKARLLVRSHQSSNIAFEDAAVDTWRKSGLAQDMTLLLSDPGELLNDDDYPSDHVTALPSTDAQGDGNLDPESSNNDRNTEEQEMTIQTSQNRQLEAFSSTSKPHSLDCLEASLPADTSDLLDFYFTYTHSWFPIVERSEILRAFHTKWDSKNPQVPDFGRHMCLSAIIAFTLTSRGGHQSNVTYPQGENIQAQIQSRVATDNQNVELGHVQALLILILLQIGRGQLHAAWVLIAQVARMMTVIDEQQTTTPGRFNHVFNGCIYLDNFLSAMLGKTPYMSTGDQSELGKVDESGIEEWDTWFPLPQFPSEYSRMISRRPIRALSTFNALRYPMKTLTYALQTKSARPQLQGFVKDVHDWQVNLEEHHQLRTADSLNPSILFLYLIKDFVILTLMRWIEVPEPETIRIYHTTVASAIDLMEQYIKLTGMPGSSPLLMGLALQVQFCLRNTRLSMEDAARYAFDSHTNELLNTLKHHWHPDPMVHRQQDSTSRQHSSVDNNMSGSTVTRTPLHQERSSLNVTSAVSSRPMISETSAGVNDHAAPLGLIEPSENSSFRLSQQRQPDISSNNTFDSATYQEDDDDFDALFQEMVAFAPTRRPAQDLAFAQNMGFLDDQFDQDFLDSLNNAAMLMDNTESAINVDDNHPT